VRVRRRVLASVPWWAKVIGKCIASRLPVPYRAWKALGLFEHGDMDQPDRAWSNFIAHAEAVGVLRSGPHQAFCIAGAGGKGPTVMELGPGDSLFSAQIAFALGACRTILVDVGAFASEDLTRYMSMGVYLDHKGLSLPLGAATATSVNEMLSAVAAEYLVDGIRSLRALPPASVDYCFSNAVLEHVALEEFTSLVQELHRALRPGARSIHRVDLRDHLGGGLNNLRFSRRLWEGRILKPSGFYTNRLRFRQILDTFQQAGFRAECSWVDRWESLPIDRHKLSLEFRHLPEEELVVKSFDLIATRI
jgi:SAM-dependent methyltransferase